MPTQQKENDQAVHLTPLPRTYEIKNWQTLTGFVALCSKGSWIFRGEHHDPEHLRVLRPKIGRPEIRRRGLPYRFADERQLLEAFKRRARPLVGHEPASDLEWLAIAQHHGLPTRLLDWTENLLAAAYFASSAMNTRWGLIYAVPSLRTVTPREEKTPFRTKRPGIYRPPHISPRIPAQSSVFTLHPKPTTQFRPANLHTWTIARFACSEIKGVLDSTGINVGSLFPDLDGLAASLTWRHKWGRGPR